MASRLAGNRRFESQKGWEEPARLLKVMAHPVRLLILHALSERSLCVMDLNTMIPIPQPQLSQHMAVLKKAELVDRHKDGSLRCYYLLRPDLVRGITAILKKKHPIRKRTRASVQREVRGE